MYTNGITIKQHLMLLSFADARLNALKFNSRASTAFGAAKFQDTQRCGENHNPGPDTRVLVH